MKNNQSDAQTLYKGPSALEGIVLGITSAQEFVRIDIRNSLKDWEGWQPESFLEKFYLFHWGDFMDGYLITFATNCFVSGIYELIVEDSAETFGQNHWFHKTLDKASDNIKNIISGAIGTYCVIQAETGGMIGADVNDIPAGILGVLTHMGIRCFVTNRRKKEVYTNNNSESLQETNHLPDSYSTLST